MTPVPSRRLLHWGTAATLAALAIVAFPAVWLPLLTFDILLVGAVLLDWLVTPGPVVLEGVRSPPDRISVLQEHAVTILIRNRSRFSLQVRRTRQLSGDVSLHARGTLKYSAGPWRGALAVPGQALDARQLRLGEEYMSATVRSSVYGTGKRKSLPSV